MNHAQESCSVSAQHSRVRKSVGGQGRAPDGFHPAPWWQGTNCSYAIIILMYIEGHTLSFFRWHSVSTSKNSAKTPEKIPFLLLSRKVYEHMTLFSDLTNGIKFAVCLSQAHTCLFEVSLSNI